jgi:hypothetical protein
MKIFKSALPINTQHNTDVMNVKLKANDATEDIFINFTTVAQTDSAIKAGIGANTRKIPADTATPLPPLNMSQIGYE